MARQKSIARIRAEIAKLQKQAQLIEQRAKPGLDQIAKLVKKHRLTLADVQSVFGSMAKTQRAAKGKVAPRKPVEPKYRNPESGVTWSGRGRMPKWLEMAIASGKTREDFEIK